ncbi:SET and MYND domain-containing protein 4-like [Ananas comosus]|uniref:SET and MYND domain-containing protein 4-like n=1 Tax=Ananas comosus TaxID=4615 RepID=A0A6P5FPN6_ANACO|nr:SET and MYND domain-containing protein 4-like [Ananas comosus]
MERLKSLIPNDLKHAIGESTTEKLALTCSSLLHFLRPLPLFHQVIEELTGSEMALCRKSQKAALDLKLEGNRYFSKGEFHQALSFYSQALRQLPMSFDDIDVKLGATLYVNRAAAMHKLGLFEECLRDCNRAIGLLPSYVKAWYRRGKVNASLRNYVASVSDLEVALSMESSTSGKSIIQEELKMVTGKHDGTNGARIPNNSDTEKELTSLADSHPVVLQCVSTPAKGKGMASPKDIPPASLLHTEEPLAAVVMKSCRETHCHFCFNEVPADVLFCSSCTIPIYCSQKCQEQAGGEQFCWNRAFCPAQNNFSPDLAKHITDVTSANYTKNIENDKHFEHIPEHRHECGGTNWPAVFPPDIVLAGRVVANSMEKRRLAGKISVPMENFDFAHHYDKIPPDSKLEFHMYAIVLSFCLQTYYSMDFPCTESTVSQLVLLICQIKVNSMAIIHIKSTDEAEKFKKGQKLSAVNNVLSSIEQVRVGQAIYLTGSLFNHSCQPNVHAYFLSRTLFLRSTEFVPAWSPLELSYGPQVGQMDLLERQKSLEEQYYFTCQCLSCSELNLSDLVINAFRCPKRNCLGAVVETAYQKPQHENFVQLSAKSHVCRLSLRDSVSDKEIQKVAHKLLEKSGAFSHVGPAYCLSCGSRIDLDSAIATSNNALLSIKRLKDSIILNDGIGISNALHLLDLLKSVRHPYSKLVAQAEDYIAEAFVKIGNLEPATKHCNASIKILEKLYHAKHIVVGHELIKLATIQLHLGDGTGATDSIKQVEVIFSLHYGPDVNKIFPYIGILKEDAVSIASRLSV